MRYTILLLVVLLASCDYGSFDKDKRQIMAKDYIRSQLPSHSHDFDITAFREDTLNDSPDSNFKRPIAYTLNYSYTDSTGVLQTKTATVLFTPNGHSIISTLNH